MVIESIVYCFILFKEINSDGPFHDLEDCQHNLLYSCAKNLFFTEKSVSFQSMDCFRVTFIMEIPSLTHLKHLFFFYWNLLLCTHHKFFSTLLIICTSELPKILQPDLFLNPDVLCLICHFKLTQNKLYYKPIYSLHLCKNNLKKIALK